MDFSFWHGRDNYQDLALTADDVAIDATNITRVIADLAGAPLDSDTDADAFEFPVDMTYRDAGGTAHTAKGIRLMFGALDAGSYAGELIIFTSDYPSGLVWDSLSVLVRS